MSVKLQELQKNYGHLISSIPFVEEDLDYSILEKHMPHLDELDRIGNSAISVFDMFRKTHVYTSPSYRKRLSLPDDAYEGPEGFDLLMHPDDLLSATASGYHFLKMAMMMETDRLRNVKLVNDYRIRKTEDSWMRMTEQHQILETDPHGNIWLSLSVVDVSPDQDVYEPMRSRLVHQQTGEVCTFNGKTGFLKLSIREKQILQLIARGHVSKQIAGELHISVHTVNTHRQNIIEKMNVTNTAEAVRMASRMGLFE